MDTKFRKLISRLSIKEKKLEKDPYPRMLSACPLVLPSDSVDMDINGELKGDEEMSVEVGQPLTSPNSNILTSVKFPCPTLLRKSKSMCEGAYYEEVKPRVLDLTLKNGDSAQGSPRESLGSESSDENNNVTGQRSSGSTGDGGADYMNLQEVEQERRRLMAAQRVRAKYAESWIDGQVVDDSILGDNKEKTKLYWETLMRQDQFEREKLNQLNNKRAQRTSSNTSPIIHKINAEIQELHRREKELMSRGKGSGGPLTSSGSQAEDDDDVFSSNSSSVDEFEHAESPRLESGFYSNLGEDDAPLLTTTEGPKGAVSEPEVTGPKVKDPESVKVKDTVDVAKVKASMTLELSTTPQEVQQLPLVSSPPEVDQVTSPKTLETEDDDAPKKFTFQKETPIEREIRLASERDEEHRQRRLSSMTEPLTPKVPVVVAETKKSPEPVPVGVSVKAKISELKDKRFESAAKGPAVRNIQYQMATERLRKEMLEAQRREDELQKLHRTVSMSTLSILKNEIDAEILLKTESTTSEAFSHALNLQNGHSEIKHEVMVQPEVKDKEDKLEDQKGKEIGNSLSNSPVPVSPAEIPVEIPNAQVQSPTFSKPGIKSFNSIQRYLLKSSVQLRIAKNFQLPPPQPETPVEKPEPIKIEEEVEAPRRKLVPATHKIQNELREMQEREKELALIRTRSFKSTPNLLVDLKAEGISVDEPNSAEVSFMPKERKRSNLINQWEMIIQSGN